MSYENPIIKMHAENVEHNCQAVHVTCHCQMHWKFVKEELEKFRKLNLENNRLLKTIHQQMLQQEAQVSLSSIPASPSPESESASVAAQNLLKVN